MAVSISEFWDLLQASQLLTASGATRRREQFAAAKPDKQEDVEALAEWLIKELVISEYQSKVLLAGRPGPFVYGDYLVYDRLASGRFQGAFKALHPVTKFRVVLLFHAGRLAEDPQAWSALASEVGALAQIQHPHLSRVFHACETGTHKFTVVEYLRGKTVEERLAAGPLPWPVACRMVWQASSGLERLMEAGELHGAIRLDNLWLDSTENVKLVLPALQRVPLMVDRPAGAGADAARTATAHRAPELAEAGRVPNPQTEVYSLGWTLQRLIVGTAPAADAAVEGGQAAAASLELHGVPAEVSKIAAQMMSRDLTRRYRHPHLVTEAMAAALRRFEPAQLECPKSKPAQGQGAYDEWLRKQGLLQPPGEAGQSRWAGESSSLPPGAAPPFVPRATPVAGSVDASGVPVATDAGEEATGDSGVLIVPNLRETIRAQAMRARDAATGRNAWLIALTIGIVLVGLLVRYSMSPGRVDAPTWTVESSNNAPRPRPPRSRMTRRPPVARAVEAAKTDGAATKETVPETSASPAVTLVPDDGRTLWASPTNGSALSLAYVAPGVHGVLFARPVEMLGHPEGQKIAAALELQSEPAIRNLELLSGVPMAGIEQLTIAWTERTAQGGGGRLAPMYVVRFSQPPKVDAAQAAVASAVGAASESVFQTPLGDAYLPAKENGMVMVIGEADQIRESKQLAGSAPPLRRELEKLLLATDSQRMATLVFLPDALAETGSELGPLARGIQEFLGSDARAAALSAHLVDQNVLLEMRIERSLDRPAEQLAQEYQGRVSKLPESLESYLAGFEPRPYGKRVLLRFPSMLKLLDEFTRSAAEGDQAVLRCYLPASAAHNLLLATELLLAERPGSAAAATGEGTGAAAPLADRLERITSLSFASDTLESALQMLATDLGVKIEILGADLQAEGITKNQSFSLDEHDRPAGEILRTIVRKANPDGKLVYVIKQTDAGGEMLCITTRAAATKRGDRLPDELAEPPSGTRGSAVPPTGTRGSSN